MAKVAKDTVFFVSSAGTGYFYSSRRNKKKTKGETKLSLLKYDPIARKHVKFEEKKLSKLKKAETKAAKPAEASAEAKPAKEKKAKAAPAAE